MFAARPSSPHGIPPFEQASIVLRGDGTVCAWNAGATALYGFTAEEAQGRRLEDLVPTTWPIAAEEIAAIVASAGGWTGVVVRRNRDDDALLLLAILAADGRGAGGMVETTLRLPDEVAAVSLAPEEDERTDRLFVLEPARDASGAITDMEVAYVNREAATSLGLTTTDLVGRRASEVLPGYLESPMFETHRRVALSRETVTVAEWRYEIPPGSGVEHSFAGTVVPFGAGVASRSRDVTAERRALQALDDAQARVRIALALAPVAVGQLNRDLEYEWLLDNITPDDPADMIGRGLGERTAPDDRERLRAAGRRVLTTGEAEQLEIHGGPGFTRALEVAISPREEVGGGIAGVRVALVDVSTHRRLEAELRESRDMMRAVLEHTPAAVLVKDLEGRILFINARAAALLGTTPAQAVGVRLAELLTPEAAARLAEQDAHVLRTGDELEVRDDLGDAVLLVRRFAVPDADGQVRALGSIAVDLGLPPAAGSRGAAVSAPPAP